MCAGAIGRCHRPSSGALQMADAKLTDMPRQVDANRVLVCDVPSRASQATMHSDRLSIYYRTKAQELRNKAEACKSRTARMWLIEGAGECELRAIQAEADLAHIIEPGVVPEARTL